MATQLCPAAMCCVRDRGVRGSAAEVARAKGSAYHRVPHLVAGRPDGEVLAVHQRARAVDVVLVDRVEEVLLRARARSERINFTAQGRASLPAAP